MKINELTPEPYILRELGERLARIRKNRGYTQPELADIAGIGVATLRRLESGSSSQIATWIKILRALGMIDSIDKLITEKFDSPMQEVLENPGRKRKTNKNHKAKWGDEP